MKKETERERSVRLALRTTDAETALAAARGEIADLRAALRPFADAYRKYGVGGLPIPRMRLVEHCARAAELVPAEKPIASPE